MQLRAYLALFGFCILVLATNVFAPVMIKNIWTRDGDVGNWFLSGVLLTELSLLGMLGRLNYGRMEWRMLIGAAISISLIISAWFAFAWTGPIGANDAKALLSLLFGSLAAFTIVDLLYLYFRRLSLESTINEPNLRGAFDAKFSLMTILSFTALVAVMAFLWRMGLDRSELPQRDIRSYYSFPTGYLILMAAYLWSLHITSLSAILNSKDRISLAICILLCTAGLEGMRRVQEIWTVWKLDYLNWEFPLIVFGFVVAHIVVGYSARCLGWELRRATT